MNNDNDPTSKNDKRVYHDGSSDLLRLISNVFRLVRMNLAASFTVATLRYIILFQSVPFLFIMIDTIFYTVLSLPVSIISFLFLFKNRGRVITGIVFGIHFLIVAISSVRFSLNDAQNSGLSQKINGQWVFLDGDPTVLGMVIIGLESFTLSILTVIALWYAIKRKTN